MKSEFDKTMHMIYKSIRKPALKSGGKTILSKKDQHRADDIRKGRKNWKDYE